MWGGEGEGEGDPDVFRVGSGEECEARVFLTFVCPSADGGTLRVREKCDNERACPVCSLTWAWGEATRAADRWGKALRSWSSALPPRHVVVSDELREAARTPAQVRGFRARAWDQLKKMGARAASLVYHGERHAGEDFYAGPHVHAIVAGRVDADRRNPRWVVKTMRESQASLKLTLAYLLNHATVSARGHAVVWYGDASYNRLHVEAARREGPPCPMCGLPMELVLRVELPGIYPLVERENPRRPNAPPKSGGGQGGG